MSRAAFFVGVFSWGALGIDGGVEGVWLWACDVLCFVARGMKVGSPT